MVQNLSESNPSVAIILVNYNGFEDTVECVKSIKKIEYSNYKIIVVDNASTITAEDTLIQYLKNNTIYIESEDNIGFSGGNNLGIKWAQEHGYDYVMLLNNDTIVKRDFLNILISAAVQKKNLGIMSGKILFWSTPDKIWYGGGHMNPLNGGGVHDRWNEVNPDDTSKVEKVTFITGCLMLIPVNVINKIGLLEESYFLYAEDTEYCYRAMRYGYELYSCDNSLIYHKVSASTGATSPATQYYNVRNTLFVSKEYAKSYRIVHLKYFYTLAKDVIRGRKQAKPVIYAMMDYYRGRKGKLIKKF